MIAEKTNKKAPAQVLPDRYMQVLRLLPTEKTITQTELSKLTGINSQNVRFIISQLVTEYNVPIGTSNIQGGGGYYIITDEHRLNDTLRNLKGRADKITKRYEALQQIDLNTWKDHINYEL